MNIALDISPLKIGHFLQHRVRGTGFYTKNLMEALQRYYPQNKYTFFTRGEKILVPIDITHIPYFEPFFITLPLKKTTKTVVTVHDLTPLVFPEHFPAGVKGLLKWQIQKNVLKRMNAIVTDSYSSKKDIIRFTGIKEEKVHVVYLAAGEQFIRIKNQESPQGEQMLRMMEIKEKYHLPDKFVLYVGDITWNKNLVRLIQAIKKTNIPLIMIGKALTEKKFDNLNPWNKDRIEVQKLLEEDTQKNRQIHCLGYVSDEDLVFLYNMATVFVMPSLYEGFGLPILEAMSCGCPVITTKDGSLQEVGGEAAYYVNGYDVEEMSKGIENLFSNTDLQKILSEKGIAQAKKFSWEHTALETLKVYQSVL